MTRIGTNTRLGVVALLVCLAPGALPVARAEESGDAGAASGAPDAP